MLAIACMLFASIKEAPYTLVRLLALFSFQRSTCEVKCIYLTCSWLLFEMFQQLLYLISWLNFCQLFFQKVLKTFWNDISEVRRSSSNFVSLTVVVATVNNFFQKCFKLFSIVWLPCQRWLIYHFKKHWSTQKKQKNLPV